MDQQTLQDLVEALQRGEAVALATIVGVEGSSPAGLGAKILIYADGRTSGTIGGGTLELQVVEDARAALDEGRSQSRIYTLREEGDDAGGMSTGMLCGGEVDVFIEVHRPPPTLLLVGGGHVGQPLADMARRVGFHVEVVDIDPERRSLEALEQAVISEDSYVVIMTAEAGVDEDALRQVVEEPAAYIGMIGSQRKVAIIFQHLREAGVPEQSLARVRAPIGLDLGGRTPAEIALAVLAEIVAVRYRGNGQPLSALRAEATKKL